MTPALSEHAGLVEVVRVHGGALARLARRLVGSCEDAEDIIQEALLRAYADRMLRARRGGALAASVFTITHNLSVDYLRRKRLRLLDPGAFEARTDPRARTADEAAQVASLREAVRAAVAALPESHRAVAALRFGSGLTYRACARKLRISEPAVVSRLHRARAALRRALSPWVERRTGR